MFASLPLRRPEFDTSPLALCQVFSPSTSVSRQYHSTNAPYSFIFHSRCIIFFSQHFSILCQYHSTNAPYSFIHLPPTLHNVFLPVIQFLLSVSFHQCSILIHLPLTLYNIFLPVLQFPLSVSFQECSILIYSSTTHAV